MATAPAVPSLSASLLLGWQGATVNNHLKQVPAGCQQTPLAASEQDEQPSECWTHSGYDTIVDHYLQPL